MLTVLLACLIGAGEPARGLESRVEAVTVFESSALVRRSASVPAGGGAVVIEGLPAGLDPATVRARTNGVTITGLETLERGTRVSAIERLEALEEELEAAKARLAQLVDERDVTVRQLAHVESLFTLEEQTRLAEVRSGTMQLEVWRVEIRDLTEAVRSTRRIRRERLWACEDAEAEVQAARQRLGDSQGWRRVHDVRIELPEGAPATRLELEYVVADAGWKPEYDLRAAKDARSVELGVRASVWQSTGEDWGEVELSLSTARPNTGAQGPDPRPKWLSLQHEKAIRMALETLGEDEQEAEKKLKDMDSGVAAGAFLAPVEATVEKQGLSVRMKVARRESVLSGASPVSVLVGRKSLDVQPEYFATPALDSNVWLRARARNTSEWTLLPGPASVYFGGDFIGRASLGLVHPEAEFTLPLGPDPALVLERTLLEDLTEEPGFVQRKRVHTQRWKVRITNTGAAVAGADGSALVIVRDVLPRSTNDEIEVELVDAKPQPAKDERWKKEREEQGWLVWNLRVPRGGEATIEHGVRVRSAAELMVQEVRR
ncbi:MAG: DUF4139 domain-containing protein [Planctomycetota bacterium]|nr:DUF4139 domain-containing protein [Planctomycetota bacterium]